MEVELTCVHIAVSSRVNHAGSYTHLHRLPRGMGRG